MPQKIQIYVNNLDRRPDRLAYMSEQLNSQRISWTRHQALDAKTATDAQIRGEVDIENPKFWMRRGSQCNAISHFNIWRKLVESDDKAAIVLEDDVLISSDYRELVERDDWFPEGIGVIRLVNFGAKPTTKLLGRKTWKSPCSGRRIAELHSRTGGSGAYLITREAAIWALENKGRVRVSIDHVLFNMNVSPIARKLRVAAIIPSVATQAGKVFGTDISNPNVVKKTLKQKLVRPFYELNRMPQQFWLMISLRAKWTKMNFEMESVELEDSVK